MQLFAISFLCFFHFQWDVPVTVPPLNLRKFSVLFWEYVWFFNLLLDLGIFLNNCFEFSRILYCMIGKRRGKNGRRMRKKGKMIKKLVIMGLLQLWRIKKSFMTSQMEKQINFCLKSLQMIKGWNSIHSLSLQFFVVSDLLNCQPGKTVFEWELILVLNSENQPEKKKKKKNKKLQGAGDQSGTTKMEKSASTLSEEKPSQVRTFPNGLVVEELEMGKPDGKRAAPGKQVNICNSLFPMNKLGFCSVDSLICFLSGQCTLHWQASEEWEDIRFQCGKSSFQIPSR